MSAADDYPLLLGPHASYEHRHQALDALAELDRLREEIEEWERYKWEINTGRSAR